MDKPSENARGKPLRVLIVGNDLADLELIQGMLCASGCKVTLCQGVERAVSALEFGTFDLVVSERDMPLISGIELLRYVMENVPETQMMITGAADVKAAVQAIQDGAEEYLVKPVMEADLQAALLRARRKLAQRPKPPPHLETAYGIVGACDGIQEVFRLIEKAAKTAVNVLISGESGTGKELVARAIHYRGERARAPFVAVNCMAIPDTLLESELFGHVKGAFTGAGETRPGFFQMADSGTIFLDEIGDSSLNMQGKLLRVLQNKEVRPVGASQVRKVDTRIIAATHKNLKAMVERGLFRDDLYYRLDVIDIPVPPLRHRGDDVPLLVSHLVEKYAKEMSQPAHRFTDGALRRIRAYHWPGNVRELENLVQRLLVTVDGDIRSADLPPHLRDSVSTRPRRADRRTLAQVEADHILNVLASVDGNKTRAAQILGIDRKTLRAKCRGLFPGLPETPGKSAPPG
jgi:DNA-binding NtrC family response regulator